MNWLKKIWNRIPKHKLGKKRINKRTGRVEVYAKYLGKGEYKISSWL